MNKLAKMQLSIETKTKNVCEVGQPGDLKCVGGSLS